MRSVQTGLDLLAATNCAQLRGKRVGLLANQATVDSAFRHAADIIHESKACTLVRLFGPEHGFRGELQDMDTVAHGVDRYTGLPVVSLYGDSEETLSPSADQLTDLDVLVVDLPDIGARYYTFAHSLGYTMRVAAGTGTKILVLDRPNPIDGLSLEGAPLLKSCRSFCGYADIPNRHGLTLGEHAQLMNEGFGSGENVVPKLGADLEVLKAVGWQRSMYADQTGLPWVLPSPNMPTLDTAIIYPGSCLFEGTELSEARGTTKPLETFGAPYIDGKRWAAAALAEGLELNGAVLRPTSFLPKFQKHAEKVCGGVQIHITDRASFKPFRWCLALISAAKRLYPDEFRWRKQTFEFIDKVPAIDLLYGSAVFRELVDQGTSIASLETELQRCEKAFAESRKQFLLY